MISVIILAHDKSDLSRKCLRALAECGESAELEVVFVDNASTDNTHSLKDEFDGAFKKFVFMRNEENLSYSVANNRAAKMCAGDYLLFLNNDVTVGVNSLGALAATMAENDSVGVAGAKLLYPNTMRVQHAGVAHMLWGYVSNYGAGGLRDDSRLNRRGEIFAVTGAMLLIRRDLFNEAGGFDEEYLWGYEDIDLCLKARDAGRSVVYVPEAESLHWESATLSAKREERLLGHNYNLFRGKWGALLSEKENEYIDRLKSDGVRRAIIYGTGTAAFGLSKRLTEAGFEITGFTSSFEKEWGNDLYGKRVIPLPSVQSHPYDRIIAGSQFYFEFEPKIIKLGLKKDTLFPVVWL